MASSNDLWTVQNGVTVPPVNAQNIHILGDIYIEGGAYSGNPNEINLDSIQSQLTQLADMTTDFESGTELNNRLLSLSTNVLVPLNEYTQLYTLGMIDELRAVFGYEQYRDIVVALAGQEYTHSAGYTALLEYVFNSIEGLYKSVLLYIAHQSEILALENTIAALQAQIAGNAVAPSMSVSATLGITAQIRPEIQAYINEYGIPEGGVFDAQRLFDILEELNNAQS